MQIIHSALLDYVTTQAQESTRLRMNYNFHEGASSPSQRLLNALEPGTELPVHRHRHTAETYILLRGRLRVIFYNDARLVVDSTILDPLKGQFGVNIPAGQWHTVEALEPQTTIFEAKDGPYGSLGEEDVLR